MRNKKIMICCKKTWKMFKNKVKANAYLILPNKLNAYFNVFWTLTCIAFIGFKKIIFFNNPIILWE